MCTFFCSVSSHTKKIKLESQDPFFESSSEEEQKDEEFGFVVSSNPLPPVSSNDDNANVKVGSALVENGELEESGGSSDVLDPPPIPPRNHSLSPCLNIPYHHDTSKDDRATANIYSNDLWVKEGSSDVNPFLLEGRGGERTSAPLPRVINGTATNAGSAEACPLLPSEQGTRSNHVAEEERVLVGELNILEKMLEKDEGQLLEQTLATLDSDKKENQDNLEEEKSSKGYIIVVFYLSIHFYYLRPAE